MTTAADDTQAGLASARRGLVAGVRLTARLVELIESDRRLVGRLLPIASLALDVHLLRRLRDPKWWPGWGQWLADAADVALRSATGAPPAAVLSCAVADVIPTAVMAGIQATAGQRAVPLVAGAPPWPPRSAAEVGRMALRALGPSLSATVGYLAIEHLRGRRPQLVSIAQVGVVGTTLSVVVARHRDRVQRAEREAFAAVIDREVERQRTVTTFHERTAPSCAHDFAKVLVALGELGDDECAIAGRRVLDTPRTLVESLADTGCTLRSVLGDLPIDPPDAGRYWVPADAVGPLQARLAAAEDHAADGADTTVRVVEVTSSEIELEWLGSRIAIAREPSQVVRRFYPTSAAFVIGANYKLLPILSGSDARAAIAGACLDLSGAVVFRHALPERRQWLPLSWSIAATVFQTAYVRTSGTWEQRGLGPPIPATANCTGAALLWSSLWGRLDRTQRAAALIPLGCWLVTMLRARPDQKRFAIELLYLLMPVLGAWRLTDRLDAEADALAVALHHELVDATERAHERAVADVRASQWEMLTLARQALERLGPDMPTATAHQLRAECDALERWLSAGDPDTSTRSRPTASNVLGR